mmetsp:Transcript_67481/g.170231  ORF Transcript_67481/g.170231 Transcript_67481/m.170231 type:complete len:412 (-) Transcript_67481:212-1447(-)
MFPTGQQLVVSSLNGPLCVVNAHASMSVFALKKAVEAKTGTLVHSQRLLCGALELDDDQDKLSSLLSASSYNVTLLRRDDEHVSWLQKLRNAGRHEAYCLLRDAPEHIRGSREIVKAAVEQNYFALKFASEELRADQDFLRYLFKRQGTHCLDFASDEVRRNREFVLGIARSYEHDASHCRHALEGAAKELWSDREFVCEVVKLAPQLIEMASEDLRADGTIMLAVVEKSDNINKLIRSIPKQLLSDRGVVLAVASRSRWILPHVPIEVRTEIHNILSKESHVSGASSPGQGRRTIAASRKVPSKESSYASTSASQWPLEKGLVLQETCPFKELRVAHYCRQSLSKARRLRSEAYRKARKDALCGNSQLRRASHRFGKHQLVGDFSVALGAKVHEEQEHTCVGIFEHDWDW